jgi:putative peptide zinc metalloprotease protein
MTRSMEVAVTGTSRMELFPLRIRQDAGEFVVGRPAIGSYAVLSDGALAAAALLSRGRTIAETKATLAREHAVRAPRLRPLLETLLAAGLVKAVDGAPLAEPLAPRRYHLTFLRRRHVAWLFSRTAGVAYAVLVATGLGLVIAEPRYLPRAADALVTPSPVMNLAILWGVSLFAMTAHELAHLLAATFLGVQASFALSNRLFFAVAQTDLTDLWLVDRHERYLAYVAGLLLACAAVSALWLYDHNLLPLTGPLYRTLRLALLMLACGLLWQCNFYLRTDVYYLIANLTGCRNLSGDALSYLKATVARLFARGAPEPLAAVPERERRIVRAFAALMIVGTASVVAVGAAYVGALLSLLLGGTGALRAGPATHEMAAGSLVPLVVSLGITCCWLAVAVAAKRRKRPRVRYRLCCPEDL